MTALKHVHSKLGFACLLFFFWSSFAFCQEPAHLRVRVSLQSGKPHYSLHNQFQGREEVEQALKSFASTDTRTPVKIVVEANVPIEVWVEFVGMVKKMGYKEVISYMEREAGGEKTFTELFVGPVQKDNVKKHALPPH